MTETSTEEMTKRFHELFPTVITVDDLMRQAVNMYDEIERLRNWAAYEHAGYCGCAGGDNDCINKAYTTWKKVFGE